MEEKVNNVHCKEFFLKLYIDWERFMGSPFMTCLWSSRAKYMRGELLKQSACKLLMESCRKGVQLIDSHVSWTSYRLHPHPPKPNATCSVKSSCTCVVGSFCEIWNLLFQSSPSREENRRECFMHTRMSHVHTGSGGGVGGSTWPFALIPCNGRNHWGGMADLGTKTGLTACQNPMREGQTLLLPHLLSPLMMSMRAFNWRWQGDPPSKHDDITVRSHFWACALEVICLPQEGPRQPHHAGNGALKCPGWPLPLSPQIMCTGSNSRPTPDEQQ